MSAFNPNSLVVRNVHLAADGYANPLDGALGLLTAIFGTNMWNGDNITYLPGPASGVEVSQIDGVITPTENMYTDGFGRRVRQRYRTDRNPFEDGPGSQIG